MKRALLLGSTGLIGSRVYQKLENEYQVCRLGRSSECEIYADLSKPKTIDDLDLVNFDAVVHCAGVTDEDFESDSVSAFIQSSIGLSALIEKAVQSGAKRFIYISTSHVYGKQVGVIDEDSRADPLSDYAIAHFVAEQTLKRNAEKFESVFVLRPNAVFGEPVYINKFDRWNLIPFSFPLESVYNHKIVLRSSGEQNRNFISTKQVADLVDSLLNVSVSSKFQVMNAIGNETISVYEFARKTSEAYESVTGERCIIERPALNNGSIEDDFVYRSKFKFEIETSKLNDYLTGFISRIWRDLKSGKRYLSNN